MGTPAQQPVYYDTETSQYYTLKPQQNNSNPSAMGVGSIFGQMFGNMGMPNANNPFYSASIANRNYLGSPYGSANPDRFIPKTITPQYPDMDMLFPALNTSSVQGLMSPTQTDGAMYGAGRFLAPQTTNTQGK